MSDKYKNILFIWTFFFIVGIIFSVLELGCQIFLKRPFFDVLIAFGAFGILVSCFELWAVYRGKSFPGIIATYLQAQGLAGTFGMIYSANLPVYQIDQLKVLAIFPVSHLLYVYLLFSDRKNGSNK